ncbi:hypothetical protein ES706_06189 [subsurface metagenome]
MHSIGGCNEAGVGIEVEAKLAEMSQKERVVFMTMERESWDKSLEFGLPSKSRAIESYLSEQQCGNC